MRGPFWTPITPLTGFLLHADPHLHHSDPLPQLIRHPQAQVIDAVSSLKVRGMASAHCGTPQNRPHHIWVGSADIIPSDSGARFRVRVYQIMYQIMLQDASLLAKLLKLFGFMTKWWRGLDSNQRTGNPGRFTVCCL